MKWSQKPCPQTSDCQLIKVFKVVFRSLLISCLFAATATFAYADTEPNSGLNPGQQEGNPSSISPANQLKMLDLEIPLLKAELAQSNGLPNEVKGYLAQLGLIDALPKSLKTRALKLEAYLKQQTGDAQTDSTDFQFLDQKIVVLLPITGNFSLAGKKILLGIKSALPDQKITIVDTSSYDTAIELWSLVKLYQPSMIFGPVQKKLVNGMADLNHNIPMLMFNHPDEAINVKNIKVLAPGRQQDLSVLWHKLIAQNYHKVLFLVDKQPENQKLWAQFNQIWLKHQNNDSVNPIFQATKVTVSGSVDKSMIKALNVQNAVVRQNWLQRTIHQKLEVMPRPRQDYDAVVSFMSYRKAIQVTPLLSYYRMNYMDSIWFPGKLPPKSLFFKSLSFWQNTQAILPSFQINHWIQTDSVSKLNETQSKNKVGIFYALGNAAVQISATFAQNLVKQWSTELGVVTLNNQNDFMVQPQFYDLNQNKITPLK